MAFVFRMLIFRFRHFLLLHLRSKVYDQHWRPSALNSAGALQGGGGELRGIFTPFYNINFRGLCKSGGARAPAAPPSSAPMMISFHDKNCKDGSMNPSNYFRTKEPMNGLAYIVNCCNKC